MLIGRAPMRISWGGGGTDLRAYYAKYGGIVISATINKYIYGIVSKNFDSHFQVISADFQSVFNSSHHENGPKSNGSENSELDLTKAILEHFHLGAPFNVFIASEVPPGTGLGSSGAAAVGIITICSALTDDPMKKHEVAELAYHIEVDKLNAHVGKQDQYASAFGGINCIHFDEENVTVEPLRLAKQTIRDLECRLMLFFTGNSRQASSILRLQESHTRNQDGVVIDSLHQIKAIALAMKNALETEDLSRFGKLLDESWQHKKKLASSISNSAIDEAYLLAKENGATGGKITGAGGGGFLMLYCEEERQAKVRAALAEKGLHEMRFAFEFQGARVLLNTTSLEPILTWGDQR